MYPDTQKAISILEQGGYTCAVCRNDAVYTATLRGVRPLLNWLDEGPSLEGFCAADRVVGRAAAFLYCLLGVTEVYAKVMSRPAAQVLTDHGISIYAETFTDGIINRKGTGPCPFEDAVMEITDPAEALITIRAKLADMLGG